MHCRILSIFDYINCISLHVFFQVKNGGNCTVAPPVGVESQSAADAASCVRPPSLSTSHDVTVESWSVAVVTGALLVSHKE